MPSLSSGLRLKRFSGARPSKSHSSSAKYGVVLREVLDQPDGEHGQVARGHAVVGVRPAAGVDEVRVAQAEVGGALVHELGEGRLGARKPLRHDHGGVVARLHDDAADELLDGRPVALVEEHGRAAHGARLGRDGEPGIEIDAAILQRLEQHVERHELRHRGRRQRLVGVLVHQHRVGGEVHDVGRARLGLEGDAGCGERQQQRQGGAEAARDGPGGGHDGLRSPVPGRGLRAGPAGDAHGPGTPPRASPRRGLQGVKAPGSRRSARPPRSDRAPDPAPPRPDAAP